MYARTVSVGLMRLRSGAVGCGAGAPVRGSVSSVLLGPPLVTAWLAAAGGLLAAPRGRRPAGGGAAWGDPARNVYPSNPSAATSASASTAVQFRRRRPDAWPGASSSSRLTADSTPDARWAASYSQISGSGSAPTALAMLRMSPRA